MPVLWEIDPVSESATNVPPSLTTDPVAAGGDGSNPAADRTDLTQHQLTRKGIRSSIPGTRTASSA
jgi:hypothetical protein